MKLADEDPPSGCARRRETGRPSIAGMGELQPGDHRPTGCCASSGRRERGPAPGGLPRGHHQEGAQGGGPLCPADGCRGQLRPRDHHHAAPTTSALGSASRTRSSGARSQGYIPAVDPGLFEAMETGVLGRVSHGGRQGRARRRLLPTRSIRRRWPSRSQAPWRSGSGEEGSPRATSGPSRMWRLSFPRTHGRTSWAI